MKGKVSLTVEQAHLCEAVLCQDLMRVSGLLASNKGVSGMALTSKSKRELMGLSNRLQLTLLAFGVTSEDLERIVKDFSMDPQ